MNKHVYMEICFHERFWKGRFKLKSGMKMEHLPSMDQQINMERLTHKHKFAVLWSWGY